MVRIFDGFQKFRFIKERRRLTENDAESDPIGIPMTWKKILESTWKELLFNKNCKQDFISWRE